MTTAPNPRATVRALGRGLLFRLLRSGEFDVAAEAHSHHSPVGVPRHELAICRSSTVRNLEYRFGHRGRVCIRQGQATEQEVSDDKC